MKVAMAGGYCTESPACPQRAGLSVKSHGRLWGIKTGELKLLVANNPSVREESAERKWDVLVISSCHRFLKKNGG